MFRFILILFLVSLILFSRNTFSGNEGAIHGAAGLLMTKSLPSQHERIRRSSHGDRRARSLPPRSTLPRVPTPPSFAGAGMSLTRGHEEDALLEAERPLASSRKIHLEVQNKNLEEYLSSLRDSRRDAILGFYGRHQDRISKAFGARIKHHVWEGGLADSITQNMFYAEILYQAFHAVRPELMDFSLDSVFIVLFFYNLHKMGIMTPDSSEAATSGLPSANDYAFTGHELDSITRDFISEGIRFTPEELIALKFIRGEGRFYSKERLMSRLGAFCHQIYVLGARVFPKQGKGLFGSEGGAAIRGPLMSPGTRIHEFTIENTTLDYLLENLRDPRRSQILAFHHHPFIRNKISYVSRGAETKHQAWVGGYADHLRDIAFYLEVMYKALAGFDLPFIFDLESSIICGYFHDFDKIVRDTKKGLKEGIFTAEEVDEHVAALLVGNKNTWFSEMLPKYFGIAFSETELNALKFAHGELEAEQASDIALMTQLAAFTHIGDNNSARFSPDFGIGSSRKGPLAEDLGFLGDAARK